MVVVAVVGDCRVVIVVGVVTVFVKVAILLWRIAKVKCMLGHGDSGIGGVVVVVVMIVWYC